MSASTVGRTIDRCFGCFKPAKNRLPEHLMFDEFKSVKNVSGSMSFIYADAEMILRISQQYLLSLIPYSFYQRFLFQITA